MTTKFRLVMEAVDTVGLGSYGYRIGTQLPGGQLHWACQWLPMKALTEQTINEMVQVMDDLWMTLVHHTVGIQQELHF
jgi:hypothetical protein